MAVIIPEEDVRSALAPHESRLYAVVENAFRRWLADGVRLVANPTARMRANVIHDLMIEEARVRFDGVPGVDLIEANARKMLILAPGAIANPLLVQFKKLTEKNTPTNYPTQTAMRFDLQQPLPGIAQTGRVTIGYHLDSLGTELLSVLAVYMNGTAPAWSYPLEKSTATVLPMRPAKSPPRLKPKSGTVIPLRPTGVGDGDGDGESDL